MNVIHLSAECYPVAKVGGLGDVVGALPKYLNSLGINACVVLPYYDRKFVRESNFETVYEGCGKLGHQKFDFIILKEITDKLGFPLYLIKIPGLLDRQEVYSYPDETEQFVAFQLAFLEWMVQTNNEPDVIHCHDHHTGLIPFLVSHSSLYNSLKNVPTICTIHNGEYQGWIGWDKVSYLPEIDLSKSGLLDWGGCINSLATAVKCCWRFTTVSPGYLKELSVNSNGLELLFQMEEKKGIGIINGIDTQVWDPKTDERLIKNYDVKSFTAGKKENKKHLCNQFELNADLPLIVFIGRLVGEKGADLLPEIIKQTFKAYQNKVSILILGSGEKIIEKELLSLKAKYKKQFALFIGYDEDLAHRIYAGADFILMPSRVEPCGLNQLYSLRYGTLPIVNNTGGLGDTIIDFEEANGYGILFDHAAVSDAMTAVARAITLYNDEKKLSLIRKKMMNLNFSWDKSAKEYIQLYKSLIKEKHGL
ncbi:glycogen synthase [Daejeonella oryzae]|uniref:glycogen synthase n=1 Tax=Daejeonella oryzae TaxID=1122943 RepID=UPI000562D784|nr:glycogen/starch synthase [Daejeonella oryzae]